MKILNAKQLKSTDEFTVNSQGIRSLDLMERAAIKSFSWIENHNSIDESSIIHIFCGMGNNGGDGLALARLLSLEFFDVQVYIVHFSDRMSDDFITNYNRLEEFEIVPISLHAEDDFPTFKENEVIIDAIFGTGIHKTPAGFTLQLIKHINQSGLPIISLDVPSGLFIDKPVLDIQSVIRSEVTLSFHLPKLAFMLPDNGDFVPHFELFDIGLDENFIATLDTSYHYTTPPDLLLFFKKRKKFSHKGSFGHALMIGGSFGKMGSIQMASQAALKIGSGWVTAYIPKCGYTILQTTLPEIMVEVDAESEIQFFNSKTKYDVIGIGMGLGISEKTTTGFYQFLSTNDKPIVIDADALNIIANNKEMFQFLHEKTILTPHPGELERLLGSWKNDYEKLEKLKNFTHDYPCTVVLKGAHTTIVQQGVFYFNSSGNPALAKAGVGDVLTGLITGLLAQNYTPLQAAMLGVYLHGMSADIYTTIHPQQTFMPTDIVNFIPGAINHLINPYNPNDSDDDIEDGEDPDFLNDDDLPF